MATFGKYEVVTELHSGERGAVFSARVVGGGREIKHAVKTFNPRSLDMDEQFWEGQSFVERARVQQRAAEAGGPHWAPIYETGTSPAGTYYVTDYHPLSAQSLVSGRVDVGAGVLYAIVRSVVGGLAELKAAAGRAHGNLKATNILINSRGDVAVAGAVLTDPASAADAAKSGEAGDLHALGELIHLLVTGRPFGGSANWPVEPGREWAKLGRRQGAQWRRLCNDLLSPDPSQRPAGLDAVNKRLRRLVPRRARPSRRLSLAVAAAVVLVAAGAAALLGVRDAGARKEVCAAKERWAGNLTSALSDPKRRALLQSDADLLRVLRELDAAELNTFDCGSPAGRFGFSPDLRKFRQTQATLDAVRRAERGLSPIQWRRLAWAAELQGRFEARGWTKPALHLADCIAGARPGSENLAEGIERFLLALAAVERDLPEVQEQWVRLQSRTRDMDETRDPVMKAFANYLRTAAASSVELTDAGFGSRAGMHDASERADALLALHKDLRQGNYDEKRFNDEVVNDIKKLAQVQARDIDRWLSALPTYKVEEDKVREAVAELRRQAVANEKLVRESGVDEKQEPGFGQKLEIVRYKIEAFAAEKIIPRDLEDNSFKEKLDLAKAQVAQLKTYIRMEDITEWLKKLDAPATSSEEIRNYWDRWTKSLAKQAAELADQPLQIAELQANTRRLADVLAAFDEAVPPPPKDLNNDVFAEAAGVKREEVMAGLLKTASSLALEPDAGQKALDSEPVKAADAAYSAWSADLIALRKDFPLGRLLSGDAPVDEKWAAAKPQFWNDRIVQTIVEQDLARLKRLRALEARPRAELVAAAQSEKRDEVALHAWRMLGAEGVTPPWPTRPGELKTEADIRRRLFDLLQPLAQTDDGRRAGRELNETGARRWRRFAEAAGDDEAMLASAAELREAFGVGAEQFAALPAETRFNLSLLETRRRLRGGTDEGLEALVGDMKAAAAQVADRAAGADLLRRLARADEKEAFAGQARGDEYTVPRDGADAPLVFRRVKAPGRRPFYLTVGEVSFAQFAAGVDANSAWDDLRSLVWWPQPGDIGDPRRGPRTWEWVMKPAPRMYATTLWLAPEDANDYPKEFREGRFNAALLSDAVGGTPKEHHPVQYVSAEAAMYFAALTGCRLPTSDEWRAAYDGYEKDVPAAEWNLRDRTWEQQRDHVAAALAGGVAANGTSAAPHGPHAPDADAYVPSQPRVGVGTAARAHPHRDGTLFFRPAGRGGGRTFHHLVGNVAEFVCDASDAFEQLPEKNAVRVKAFAAEAAPRLSVIGGSALSPPEVPFDVPQRVKPGTAYADVGFRLAFTAPSRNLAEKLEWVLAGQGFLKPGGDGAAKTARAEKVPPQS